MEDMSPDTDPSAEPADFAVQRPWRPDASSDPAASPPDPSSDSGAGPDASAEPAPAPDASADLEAQGDSEGGDVDGPTGPEANGEEGPPAEAPSSEEAPSDSTEADDPLGPEDASEHIRTESPEEGAETGPELEAAWEEGKRMNEEALADEASTSSWTNRLDEAAERADASRSHDPDQDGFYTDQRRGVRGAEQIEEEIQDFVYEVNDGTVGTDWTPETVKARKTATMFAILVSKVAEDMSYQRQSGDEFWDPRKIMRRQIDNRPLRHCKMEYTKRRLALLVDTSPSCRDEAVFYSKIASGAMLRDDIDIFLCPNGQIDARFDPEPMRFVDDDRGDDWDLDGRTVLYFTDWDGAEEIVTHSRTCNLYWFDNCPPQDYWESRRDRRQRVRLRYRGRHFHCPDQDTFRKLARKIRP